MNPYICFESNHLQMCRRKVSIQFGATVRLASWALSELRLGPNYLRHCLSKLAFRQGCIEGHQWFWLPDMWLAFIAGLDGRQGLGDASGEPCRHCKETVQRLQGCKFQKLGSASHDPKLLRMTILIADGSSCDYNHVQFSGL